MQFWLILFTKQSQIRRIDATNYKVLTTTIPAAIYEEKENKIVSIFSGIKDKEKQKQANYYNNNRIVLFWNDSINKSFCYKKSKIIRTDVIGYLYGGSFCTSCTLFLYLYLGSPSDPWGQWNTQGSLRGSTSKFIE